MNEDRPNGHADDRKGTGERVPRGAEQRPRELPSPQLADPDRDQHGEQQKPTTRGDEAATQSAEHRSR